MTPDTGQLTPDNRIADSLILAGMFVGMALIYRTVSLPWIGVGLVIFGALALLRPNLALLFVPIVAPWYLSPVYIPDIRAQGTVLPLAEVLLLVVFGATVVQAWGYAAIRGQAFRLQPSNATPHIPHPTSQTTIRHPSSLLQLLPYALFLFAGVVGIALALERGPALRDFRWMVVEPVVFYGLVRWFERREPGYVFRVAGALVVSGTFVAIVGLLQRARIDLVPILLSPTKSYADEVVVTNGVSRVASVYGHPNNLGLFLGRVWPIALALAAGTVAENKRRWFVAVSGVCVLICLAGIAVSLSRGAWLGAAAAVAVLLVGFGLLTRPTEAATQQHPRWRSWALGAALLIAIGIAGGLVVLLRGGVVGGSTDVRLLFWRESLQLIARHPLGLGLDQFYYYHNPEFGRNLIDAAAMEKSEWYARHPHNLFFELWLLLTPFGLAAVIWLLVRFFRQGVATLYSNTHHRAKWLVLGALAAMAASLTHGLVDSFYFWPDLAFAFWLLLALVQPLVNKR